MICSDYIFSFSSYDIKKVQLIETGPAAVTMVTGKHTSVTLQTYLTSSLTSAFGALLLKHGSMSAMVPFKVAAEEKTGVSLSLSTSDTNQVIM